MIKKLLNKIKSLFKKENKECTVKGNNCPYKIERPVEPKEVAVEEVVEDVIIKEVMICEHCKKELYGKESAKDTDGSSYIWCNKCNYVNKINNGKVIRKDNNGAEVMKAFKLFKEAGVTASNYSMEQNGERKSF